MSVQHGKPSPSKSTPPPIEPADKRPSAELVLDKDHSFPTPALKRHGGRKIPTSKDAVRTEVPRLSIVMLVCGTRGDVQPFIALGLKMKVHSLPSSSLYSLCLFHVLSEDSSDRMISVIYTL